MSLLSSINSREVVGQSVEVSSDFGFEFVLEMSELEREKYIKDQIDLAIHYQDSTLKNSTINLSSEILSEVPSMGMKILAGLAGALIGRKISRRVTSALSQEDTFEEKVNGAAYPVVGGGAAYKLTSKAIEHAQNTGVSNIAGGKLGRAALLLEKKGQLQNHYRRKIIDELPQYIKGLLGSKSRNLLEDECRKIVANRGLPRTHGGRDLNGVAILALNYYDYYTNSLQVELDNLFIYDQDQLERIWKRDLGGKVE